MLRWSSDGSMLCVICGGENSTSGCHLVVFAHHFMATHPIGVVEVLDMPVKKLSKMAGNLVAIPQ